MSTNRRWHSSRRIKCTVTVMTVMRSWLQFTGRWETDHKRDLLLLSMRSSSMEDDDGYYMLMINALSGLEDNLDANSAPEEAKRKLREVVDICWGDYKARFGGGSSVRGPTSS